MGAGTTIAFLTLPDAAGRRITVRTGIGSTGTIVRQGRAWLLGDRSVVDQRFFRRSTGGATDKVETDRIRTIERRYPSS